MTLLVGVNPFACQKNGRSALSQRWPNADLLEFFREVSDLRLQVLKSAHEACQVEKSASERAFEFVCQHILTCARESNGQSSHNGSLRLSLCLLRERFQRNWLQAVASTLSMMMHHVVDPENPISFLNHRRCNEPISSYPNSPSVSRFLANLVVSSLLRSARFRQQAPGTLNPYPSFKIVDPSMESGQLLLEVCLAWIRKLMTSTDHHNHEARVSLIHEKLQPLCSNIIGIDQCPFARKAVQTIFSLLSWELKLKKEALPRLITDNSLKVLGAGELEDVDAIINNPPWGEKLSLRDKELIRSRCYASVGQLDSYIAFVEIALRALRDGGIFAFVIPSQFLAMRNARQLRALVAERTDVHEIILLPRAAFASATVRGLVIAGRKAARRARPRCQLTSYSMIYDLKERSKPTKCKIDGRDIERLGSESWWSLFCRGEKDFRGPTISLDAAARVAQGVDLSRLRSAAREAGRRESRASKAGILRGRDAILLSQFSM